MTETTQNPKKPDSSWLQSLGVGDAVRVLEYEGDPGTVHPIERESEAKDGFQVNGVWYIKRTTVELYSETGYSRLEPAPQTERERQIEYLRGVDWAAMDDATRESIYRLAGGE